MTLLHTMFDRWSTVHVCSWFLFTYVAIRYLRLSSVLLTAVLVGVCWEAVEYSWVEPLLAFREPLANRLTDIALDSAGALAAVWAARCRT